MLQSPGWACSEIIHCRKISERYARNNLRKLSKEYCVPVTNNQQKYIGEAEMREGEESDLEPGLGHEETGTKEVSHDF